MATKKQPHVDVLWEEAKAGSRKLNSVDRRRVLVYIDEIGDDDFTNVELAKIFQVSEPIIRQDKRKILQSIGAALTPEAQVMIVAQHMHEIDRLIVIAKNGMRQHNSGVMGERWYIETIAKLLKEKRETYENIGVIRKELGTLNVAEETWVATVDPSSGNLGVHLGTAEELAEEDPLLISDPLLER